MQIIQSFWSKPCLANSTKGRMGWRSEKHFLMGWALSCLTIKEKNPNISLFTDSYGAKLFVDELKLPYTHVSTELNLINSYPTKLWALGKLHAFKAQKVPFLHIDGDVFMWEKFDSNHLNSELLVQNEDLNLFQYREALNHLLKLGMDFPKQLDDLIRFSKDQIYAVNAGIIGGNNIDFIHYFASVAIDFINSNLKHINDNLDASGFAIVYEQLFFGLLAKQKGLNINSYIKKNEFEKFDISNFENRYGTKKYVHLINRTKMYLPQCREMEAQLKLDYPEYHFRISEYLKRK